MLFRFLIISPSLLSSLLLPLSLLSTGDAIAMSSSATASSSASSSATKPSSQSQESNDWDNVRSFIIQVIRVSKEDCWLMARLQFYPVHEPILFSFGLCAKTSFDSD